MISTRVRVALGLVVALGLASSRSARSFAESANSRIAFRELQSTNFAHNKVGISPVRKMVVYLPPGYDETSKRFPVIYFLPNPFDGSYRSAFDKRDAQGLFDRAIAAGVIERFILVSVDMTTPLGSSWYVNSPATGNWEDFLVKELVPDIDASFKTLRNRDSRGIAGIFMGGYGAIRVGMRHSDVFGSVYAMHPVGTGSGVRIMDSLPNWDLMANEYNGAWEEESNWGESGRIAMEVLPFFRRQLVFDEKQTRSRN
jgi:S-formylglutathione hydrolase FrmB